MKVFSCSAVVSFCIVKDWQREEWNSYYPLILDINFAPALEIPPIHPTIYSGCSAWQ